MSSLLFLIFVASSTITALLLALVNGSLNLSISVVGLVIGAAAALAYGKRRRGPAEDLTQSFPPFDPWHPVVLLLLFIAIVIVYQSLYLMYPVDRALHFGDSNNSGDLPFHIDLVKAFARGMHFWPENVEYSGESLRYPFGLDLFSSMIESLGVPTKLHLAALTAIGSLFILCELWSWGGLFLVFGFFASGGVIQWSQAFAGSEAYPGSLLDFKNLFLSCVVPQRSMLYAIPLGIYLIRNFARPLMTKLERGVMIGLFATLPLFHLHTFAFLGLYFAGYALFRWREDSAAARDLIRNLFIVLGLSLPLLWKLLAHGTQLGGALGLMNFWNFHPEAGGPSFAVYVIGNFISLWPLILFLGYRAVTTRKWSLVWPVSLFAIFLFVKVAPWEWDNIKVLMWAYLLILVAFWEQVKNWPYFKNEVVLAGFCLFLFFPGFLQLSSGLPANGKGMEVMPDQYWTECLKPNFDVNDAVVMEPDYKHPLLWAGVKTPLGFEGHVWAHGYSLEPRHTETQSILQQTGDWQTTARNLKAHWLYTTHPLTGPGWSDRIGRPACLDKPYRGDLLYEL